MTRKAVVRPLERTDLAALVQLCREHAEYERAEWAEYEREADLGELLLDSAGAHGWVVDASGELVGFATANLELSTWDARRYLHLDCLFLLQAFRGQGLGRALIAAVARTALEAGAVDVQWQTPAWNEGAAGFYRRLGATAQEKLRFTLTPQGCRDLLAP